MCKGILAIPIDKYGSMHSKEPSSKHSDTYWQSINFGRFDILTLFDIMSVQ